MSLLPSFSLPSFSLSSLPGFSSISAAMSTPGVAQAVGGLLGMVVYIWLFWILYVLIMGFYRAHLSGRLNALGYAMASPFLLLGYAVDIFCQYTLATLLFWDFPDTWKEWTVTSRLQRYLAGPDSKRKTVANFLCKKMLDPFDPTGQHCKVKEV